MLFNFCLTMLVVTAESSLSKTDSQSLLLKKIKALESVLKFKLTWPYVLKYLTIIRISQTTWNITPNDQAKC